MSKLIPCSACQRHVRAIEAACPFCHHALAASAPTEDFVPGFMSRAAALALTATLAATGCNRTEAPQRPRPNPMITPAPVYGGPPPMPQPPVPQTQKPNLNAPPPPQQVEAPIQRPDPWGSMATRYGAPPRPTRPPPRNP